MPLFTLNKSEQRKLTLFISCLGMAVLLWLFFALSNQYDYEVSTKVRFSGFPQNKAFHPLQSDMVTLHVKGTGWQLVFSRILSFNTVDLSLQNLNSNNFVTFSEQLSRLNNQFASGQKIISVSPDTLYFDFSSRTVKKVPVRLAYKLTFRPQFGISSSPIINPAFVTVTGPKEDLLHIDYWLTDSVILTGVSANTFRNVPIKSGLRANIDIYPKTVNVKIPVNEFTENSIEVPLNVLNGQSMNVKVLPNKVKITFLTALSNFHLASDQAFEASIDLNGWKNMGYQQLPVHLSRFPAYCKIISIEPQTVDFIFRD